MKRYDAAEMNERLNISVNRINGGYYIWAKRHGLQENRLTVLYALGDGKTHTQTEISREWLIPKTTVNTVVKKLISEGLLKQEGNDKNKPLHLTPSGEKYVNATLGSLYRAENAALEQILDKYGDVFIKAQEEYASALEARLKEDV